MTGNPATNPPPGKPPRFRRWYGFVYKLVGRVSPSKRHRVWAYAHAGLAFHGRMHYDDKDARRSELFHRRPGDFAGAFADCSQYAASVCHWSGVASVVDTDYTGTLGKKGRAVQESQVKPGHVVLFGAPPYVHMGVMGRNRHVLGFGTQTGPDRNTLAGLIAYFAGIGHPGYAFRDLS